MPAKPRSADRAPRVAGTRSFGLERRHQPVLPRRQFIFRVGRWAGTAAAVVVVSLAAGMCGYHFLEKLPWIDALLNASMILGGMGPVDPVKSRAGKIFASFYALYSGLAIISVAGLLLAPVVHRFLHKFHVENDSD
jgi:hypothetical protein